MPALFTNTSRRPKSLTQAAIRSSQAFDDARSPTQLRAEGNSDASYAVRPASLPAAVTE